MKPLSSLPAGSINTLLTDLDDTLTTNGKLPAQAFQALEALQRAGLRVIIITGRPAGWCDHMARMWPIDAVVGENGAFYFVHTGDRLHKRFLDAAADRAARRARLEAIAARVMAQVPGCALASDQLYRETDLAIDYCEDVPPLPLDTAERIAAIMRSEGLTAKVSSIHVNGWFGSYDKLKMTRMLFAERYKLDLDAANGTCTFVGDSPNDAPMFGYFRHSVGVANVHRFEQHMQCLPQYITSSASAAGFCELAAYLLNSSIAIQQ